MVCASLPRPPLRKDLHVPPRSAADHRPGRVIAALALPVGAAAAATTPAPLTEAQAQQVGTDAYVYGDALMEFLRQRRSTRA